VHESKIFEKAVSFVRSEKRGQAAVTYLPFELIAYRGEYFGLPASEALGPSAARPPSLPPPGVVLVDEPERPFVHEGFNASEVWVISRQAPEGPLPEKGPSLPATLAELAQHFGVPFDAEMLEKETSFEGWLVTRVDQSGFHFTAFR
jgi:hypothetical protein